MRRLLSDCHDIRVAWVPGTSLLVASAEKGYGKFQAYLLDPQSGNPLCMWDVPSSLTHNPVFLADGSQLVLSGLLWDFKPVLAAIKRRSPQVPAPLCLSPEKSSWHGEREALGEWHFVTPDGERYYYGWVWELWIKYRSGRKVRFKPPGVSLSNLAVSNRHLAVVVSATPEAMSRRAMASLLLLDGATAKNPREFEGVTIRRRKRLATMAFAPDESKLALGIGRLASVWDVESRTQLLRPAQASA
jgi:hypothetical protein